MAKSSSASVRGARPRVSVHLDALLAGSQIQVAHHAVEGFLRIDASPVEEGHQSLGSRPTDAAPTASNRAVCRRR